MEASSGDGQRSSDSLESQRYCISSAQCPQQQIISHILLLPLRIAVSSVAIKSVITTSASFSPARTEMTSELGFVYFLVRAASRKTVKVWPVSLRQYRASVACVPRVRPRRRGPGPASLVVSRSARAVANAPADAAFRRAGRSRGCASDRLSRGDAGRIPARSRRIDPCLLHLPVESQCRVRVKLLYARTLNNVSYRVMILGWKISGLESWVRGDGSILGYRESRGGCKRTSRARAVAKLPTRNVDAVAVR